MVTLKLYQSEIEGYQRSRGMDLDQVCSSPMDLLHLEEFTIWFVLVQGTIRKFCYR